ncbi:hypothetical protein A9Q99_05495 [Gammaproteobacteria bacterium 45_16_T64]|nr:hypothetical protein A9Q99_05495 [Gammaproteobacteria bacterium 45_16_T64]
MQINLLNDEEQTKEFLYYDADGIYIGRSEGLGPDPHLYSQAHYVFDGDSDMVKNLDILNISRKRLISLRKTLIAVPIKDMGKIIEINQQIKSLEKDIDMLEGSLSLPEAI